MSFNKDDQRQRQSRACQVILRIVIVQHQPDELHREADPEEEVEFHETEEDLVVGVHSLDPAVRTKVLVHLPTELGVYFPAECAVCKFRDRDDYGYDEGEDVNGDVRYAGGPCRQGLLDFLDLNDGIYKKEGVEDARAICVRVPVARARRNTLTIRIGTGEYFAPLRRLRRGRTERRYRTCQ